jgi:pimeloyl-ACP methyl ester carboxylesterase
MQTVNNKPTVSRTLIALSALLLTGLALGGSPAAADAADIGVVDKGRGPVLIFIPGLNSGSESFASTCGAFVSDHRCLLLQLPGFAGQPAVDVTQGFLETMKHDIIALLREQGLTEVTLVGHSLGGVLSMMIGLEAPELAGKIVVIDSLPFSAAIQNPAMTEELVEPQAGMIRQQMDAASDADFYRNAAMNMNGMSRSPERTQQLQQWTLDSDRATTTAAMYDLMTIDLRDDIAGLTQPVLVLGSWAAYKPYGSTLESTRAIFDTQYAAVPQVDVRMSQDGYHFLTWDDSEWVNAQINEFMGHE